MSDPAPGWDSIERAFAAAYGPEPPEHRAPPVAQQPPADGAVLNGISAYRGDDHWHFVTLGLTELAEKAPDGDPETSGLGHELTLLTPAAERPPAWGFALLLGAARTAVTLGRPFHAGARMAPGAPVDGGDSGLVALGVRTDVRVRPSAFPFGRFELLQLVGVTRGEYLLMQRAGTLDVLERLARRDPLLRTDPARA